MNTYPKFLHILLSNIISISIFCVRVFLKKSNKLIRFFLIKYHSSIIITNFIINIGYISIEVRKKTHFFTSTGLLTQAEDAVLGARALNDGF